MLWIRGVFPSIYLAMREMCTKIRDVTYNHVTCEPEGSSVDLCKILLYCLKLVLVNILNGLSILLFSLKLEHQKVCHV